MLDPSVASVQNGCLPFLYLIDSHLRLVVFVSENWSLLEEQVMLDLLVALLPNGYRPFLCSLETAILHCCCFVRLLEPLPVFPSAYLVDPLMYLVDVVLLSLVVYCRKD